MKRVLPFVCASVLLWPSVAANARLISVWPYEKLVDNSDVVALVEVKSIEKTSAVFSGHGDPERFQGYVAHMAVAWVIKGDQKMEQLNLAFFKYSTLWSEPNGALFIDFREPEQHQYLIFARKGENGAWVPTTGHYDASISVKEIKNDHFSSPHGN